MYARITTYQVKPDRIADMEARVDEVKAQVAKVAGLTTSISVWRPDGKGVTIGIWESAKAAEAGAADVQKIWAGLADMLAGPPVAEAYESVARMSG